MSGAKHPPTALRIALLQLNPTVGDLAGNLGRIERALRWAERQKAAIALTPELVLTGYPPEDLLLRQGFLDRSAQALRRLTAQTRSTALVCGHPSPVSSKNDTRVNVARSNPPFVHNSASVLQNGKKVATYHKIALPNYGVFDEMRYFRPGNQPVLLRTSLQGRVVRIALSICEDLWPAANDAYFKALGDERPDLILNLSASPYEVRKPQTRLQVLSEAARKTGAHVVYLNLIGGQDELIFDGRSLVVTPEGRVLAQAAAFAEDLLCVDVPIVHKVPIHSDKTTALKKRAASGTPSPDQAQKMPLQVDFAVRGFETGSSRLPITSLLSQSSGSRRIASQPSAPKSDSSEDILAALELSLRDYVRKNGFSTVGVAMSGGIDSALVAALAVRALGKSKVIGVTLPSGITSRATLSDAQKQAHTMGIRFHQISIAGLQAQFLQSLSGIFAGKPAGAAEENLQARIRGTLMMALSNHMGFLLLATGNKSEMAMGYCTLYGDMAGGFAPIKDLTKTWVYKVSRALNRLEGREVIPGSVLRRAPTAELRPGQKDQDTLPPYPVLDSILEHMVENDFSGDVLRRTGRYKTHELADTARRLYQNEYKRRQAPPGSKITSKAFGRDRRMPISQIGGERY